MLRFQRLVSLASGGTTSTLLAFRHSTLSIPAEAREQLTKSLTSVKEEAKGQSLDLEDMADAARITSKNLQETLKKFSVSDDKFKGKSVTLTASLKAYNTRLANLQNEARAIQGEIDSLLKLMWGTEAPAQPTSGGRKPLPPPPTDDEPPANTKAQEAPEGKPAQSKAASDFDVDIPPLAQRLEDINKNPARNERVEIPKPKPKVETVEGEVIRSSAAPATKKSENAAKEESTATQEIEIESIEVEVEGTASAAGSPSASSSAAKDSAAQQGPADTMSITQITQDLYERGVNFSDCLDAKTLRQRYRDVLAGKVQGAANPAASKKPQQQYTNQPPPPPRPQYQQASSQQSYQQQPPNTTETGIASDPYPNAHRKMIDPMKYVWEVKNELAVEKSIDPKSVELWSGKIRLEDHKRLYDYPSIQSYPIEVRQKGDIPR